MKDDDDLDPEDDDDDNDGGRHSCCKLYVMDLHRPVHLANIHVSMHFFRNVQPNDDNSDANAAGGILSDGEDLPGPEDSLDDDNDDDNSSDDNYLNDDEHHRLHQRLLLRRCWHT